ncbi:hypothetical protein STHAL_32700 [Streptomyces halstedii]|uniref:Transposase n=1 Tax=Streptomyces halstedii TaxID=1944 RepID=A0ABS6U0Y7_STRHA|nr:DUF5999 family protein [Streptomyces halstedii]MBV7674210.1 hypothetical protein [Streptomyces halstedii]
MPPSSITTPTSGSPCGHQPPCPEAQDKNRDAARLAAHDPEQGWGLHCNGVLLFEDTGELLPDGQIIAPHRDQMSGAAT